MRAWSRTATLLAASALLAAGGAGGATAGTERCGVVRVRYAGTQPMLLWNRATLYALAAEDESLIERLEETSATQELLIADGASRLERRALTIEQRVTTDGVMPTVRAYLKPVRQTEWLLADGSTVFQDSGGGGAERSPGPAPVGLGMELLGLGADPAGILDARPTGADGIVAGRRCRWFAGERAQGGYALRYRGCMAEIAGRQVALALRIEQSGAGLDSVRPFEMRAVSVDAGICVDAAELEPPPEAAAAGGAAGGGHGR